MFDLTGRFTGDRLAEFAAKLKSLSRQIGMKVSSRGWCYIMEQNRFINKDQFDLVENLINKCRKQGLLPVNFVAEESSRLFSGVEQKSPYTLKQLLRRNLSDVLEGYSFYTPDWWDGEDYYIQMVVEKVDLVSLFGPVCQDYHIPIANAKGWSSILQRAEYARRFKEAERRGLQCVLLYCGDHDPDGLRIGEAIRQNLEQIEDITWDDGTPGYSPNNLIIERFGLNFDFIEQQGYTWIDNLITGSGKDLADPNHRNYNMDYVQEYLSSIGERKCEANAIVTTPDVARDLVREAIEGFLGDDAVERFEAKENEAQEKYEELLEKYDLNDKIKELLATHDEDEDEDES